MCIFSLKHFPLKGSGKGRGVCHMGMCVSGKHFKRGKKIPHIKGIWDIQRGTLCYGQLGRRLSWQSSIRDPGKGSCESGIATDVGVVQIQETGFYAFPASRNLPLSGWYIKNDPFFAKQLVSYLHHGLPGEVDRISEPVYVSSRFFLNGSNDFF